jgi:hypothetical protein
MVVRTGTGCNHHALVEEVGLDRTENWWDIVVWSSCLGCCSKALDELNIHLILLLDSFEFSSFR